MRNTENKALLNHEPLVILLEVVLFDVSLMSRFVLFAVCSTNVIYHLSTTTLWFKSCINENM